MIDEIEQVETKQERQKFLVNAALREYLVFFSAMGSKAMRADLNYLSKVMRKQVFAEESLKLKERMKKLK